MTEDELAELVAALRRYGTDSRAVEAKRASGTDLPKSLRGTLSAFANTRGGVIVLGLDEEHDFETTGVAEPHKAGADLASWCQTIMDPPLAPLIEAHTFEGVCLVTAEVPEVLPDQKPCFYKGAGMNNGSYKRVADGDYKMTPYEVQLLVASRGQPRDDEEAIPNAVPRDLDESLVTAYLENLRLTRPAAFADVDSREALMMTRVLVKTGNKRVPSLAGLLAFGKYPQQFFPQLNATFVSYPTDDAQPLASGERFLDNATIDGNIPNMLRGGLVAVRRNMQRRGVVSGSGREDVWDYPDAALREVLVNALVHRDLSSASRGMPIQIEMYPDRLLVRNPGGLFGPVTIDQLGDGASSSRNATLQKILEDFPVPPDNRSMCENRGSGIRVMIGALRNAGMTVPRFNDDVATFSVAFPKHSLFSPATIAWIEALGQSGLSDSQHVALALLRQGDILTNPSYRAAADIDSRQATADLQDLVGRELVEQEGKARWARYFLTRRAAALTPTGERSSRLPPSDRRAVILMALASDTLSRKEIEERTGLPQRVVDHWLRILRKEGRVERTPGAAQSVKTRYWATEPMLTLGQTSFPEFGDPPPVLPRERE